MVHVILYCVNPFVNAAPTRMQAQMRIIILSVLFTIVFSVFNPGAQKYLLNH